uniref:Uncharacterized protein n=1 Tax=Candidatus Kentrum sp. FM TaxID=2126340 RepID=A0A450TRV3_9GAMM|nr:MAG: hypothetical protein BECKFM1743C_GA0114222_105651 [Candidatus Kentron sp. FM]VFJ71033.1 MAG: hypothetical protein BECKFM1743A_GA0114220_105724 [Candidatus Kentron sp. FM]
MFFDRNHLSSYLTELYAKVRSCPITGMARKTANGLVFLPVLASGPFHLNFNVNRRILSARLPRCTCLK